MAVDEPTSSTVCAARLGPDAPWSTIEVGFGQRSLLLNEPGAESGARWIQYQEVARAERRPSEHEGYELVVVTLDNADELTLQLERATAASFTSAVGHTHDTGGIDEARPAEFEVAAGAAGAAPAIAAESDAAAPVGPPPYLPPIGTTGVAAADAGVVPSVEDETAASTDLGDTQPPVAPYDGAPPTTAPPNVSAPTTMTAEATPNTGTAPDQADARPDGRRWWLLGALAVALIAVVAGFVVLTGGDEGADSGSASAPTDDAAVETTIATTSTGGGDATTRPEAGPPEDAADAISVGVVQVVARTDTEPAALYAVLEVRSTSDVVVQSYAFDLTVETGDDSWSTRFTCDAADLAPGESRRGDLSVGDPAANAPFLADCSLAGWPVDAQNEAQRAVAASVAAGAAPNAVLDVVEAVLADGTQLTPESRDSAD